MKYILSAYEMKACDRDTSERIGIPSMVLMERASLSVVEAIAEIEGTLPKRVLVVAGTGNNGGDGLAVGRLLALKGADVAFFMVGDKRKMTAEARSQAEILENLGFSIQSKLEMAEYDMVVDALFGVGLSREVEGEYRLAIEKIDLLRKRGARVCAVDIPSGICADTGKVLGAAVRADLTVTFAFAKRGHLLYPGREYTGKLLIKDIGITDRSFAADKPSAFCYEKSDIPGLLPERKPDGNKGTFGKVLLIAGSHDMGGASILCGSSILRSGAGMVKIVAPACNREIIQNSLPEALLYTFEGIPDEEKIKDSMEWADVIVAGPGLGMGENARLLMEYVLKGRERPLVVDADGLNLIAQDKRLWGSARERTPGSLILTPHPGELARLLGIGMESYVKDREGLTRRLASEFGCTVAGKDAATIVMEAGRRGFYINASGNDGMATAGSGDVLSGIIGGLLAQRVNGPGGKIDCFETVCLGVYLHGLAGDRALSVCGRYGMLASDIARELPQVMEETYRQPEGKGKW